MDYTSLQAAVKNRLAMDTDDPLATQVGDLVNQGLHLVEIAHPGGWSWLHKSSTFSTTSGTAGYAFSAINTTYTLMRITGITSPTQPLQFMGFDEATELYFPASSGSPAAYTVEGQTVTLYPTPDSTLTMTARGVISEPDLAGTSSPLMPTPYHGSIIAAAVVLYYETLQDGNRSELAGRRLDGWIGRMMAHDRDTAVPPRIRVRSA